MGVSKNNGGSNDGNEKKGFGGQKDSKESFLKKEKKTGDKGQETILDSDFVNLDDLVYAPLHALAESNHKLRGEVINNVQNMATVDNTNNEAVYHLKRINIAYDQVRTDVDDSYGVDKLQVQVPLLSIVPVTNLGIEEAEIGFSAEVRTQENMEKTERKFEARVCSPEQRDSDFLPRVSYKMKVKSIPATEGIMRLIDSLSANQVAKKLESQIISSSGGPASEKQKQDMAALNELKSRVTTLKQLYAKVNDTLDEMEQLKKIKPAHNTGKPEYDKSFFENRKEAIVNEILKYQDEIMRKEISCVISENTSPENTSKAQDGSFKK